ncbi:MAG: CPBP family intramembrane metalloprotease [Verrucomicrobia bacterium]|nr:CPBP family intramembrane metalloprotease [Verrucomicrobiota bacterium]
MRQVRTVALYFLAIFLGSALVAPWLFKLLQGLAVAVPSLSSLAEAPFPRVLNRTLMLLGAIALWPLAIGLGLRSWREIGLRKSDTAWREVGIGFLFGLGSLACVAAAALVSGARGWVAERTATEIARHLANAGSAAIIVSLIEEVFFRGLLFGGLRKSLGWPLALVASSLVYAGLHFLQRTQFAGSVDWTSGFVVLGSMLRGFGELGMMFPGLLNLAVAGALLGVAYQWTGALYSSIGLHAGWIFWLKSYGFFSRDGISGSPWFWGTGRLIDGFLALVVLSIMLCLLLLMRTRPPPKADGRMEGVRK